MQTQCHVIVLHTTGATYLVLNKRKRENKNKKTENKHTKRGRKRKTLGKNSTRYEKPKIQAPGTTFSNFSDEVGPEGGRGKCCRFGTLTGVYQGAHIYRAKFSRDLYGYPSVHGAVFLHRKSYGPVRCGFQVL